MPPSVSNASLAPPCADFKPSSIFWKPSLAVMTRKMEMAVTDGGQKYRRRLYDFMNTVNIQMTKRDHVMVSRALLHRVLIDLDLRVTHN